MPQFNVLSGNSKFYFCLICLFVLVCLAHPFYLQAAASPVAFVTLENIYANYLQTNLLKNPNFTLTQDINASPVQNWNLLKNPSNIQVENGTGPLGGNSIRMERNSTLDQMGLSQGVTINQVDKRILFFSYYFKSQNVSGSKDSDFSFYIDVTYVGGAGNLYGQVLLGEVGSNDWYYRRGFIIPQKPIKSLGVYCLFRGQHTGVAYFANLVVSEVLLNPEKVQSFDGVKLFKLDNPLISKTNAFQLKTGDDLSLSFDTTSGGIIGTNIEGTTVSDLSTQNYGGVFVKDANSSTIDSTQIYHAAASKVSYGASFVNVESSLDEIGLKLKTNFSTNSIKNTLSIHVDIENSFTQQDRALTVFVAIPVSNMGLGWLWGDYIRSSRSVVDFSITEYSRFLQTVSPGQYLSPIPFSGMSTSNSTENVGLAMSVPLTSPRLVRFSYNAVCKLFYAAIDIGTSPISGIPNKAWIDLVLYKLEQVQSKLPNGNVVPMIYPMRSAAYGYYKRFESQFTRRISPEKEGIWVAFSPLAPIPNITDFGVAVHELGNLNQIPYDQSIGVKSFRYLTEPFSSWVSLGSTSVDPANYTQVLEYITGLANSTKATADLREQAQFTLVSGLKDPETGRYIYTSEDRPWCPGKCALFSVTPLPKIKPDASLPNTYLSKADQAWSQKAMQIHTNPSNPYYNMSGEYLDSFPADPWTLDYTELHIRAVEQPILSFSLANPKRVGIVQLFATCQFAKVIGDFMHSIGKLFMANGASSLYAPWGADLFDYAGMEMKWVKDNKFSPATDESISFSRTLNNQKPYGYLMNILYSNLTNDIMTQYMQTTLFYGLYPSSFSPDASGQQFWTIPEAYEPHRQLFKKYVTLTKKLNRNGWQVITGVTGYLNDSPVDVAQSIVSAPSVLFERFSYLSKTDELYITTMITKPAYNLKLSLLLDVSIVSNGQLNSIPDCNLIYAYSIFTNQSVPISPIFTADKKECSHFSVSISTIPPNSSWNSFTEALAFSILPAKHSSTKPQVSPNTSPLNSRLSKSSMNSPIMLLTFLIISIILMVL